MVSMKGEGFAEVPAEEIREIVFTDRVKTKISAAWNSCVGDLGYCDFKLFGERLWRSLYEHKPEVILEGVGERVWPTVKDQLKEPIPEMRMPNLLPDLQSQFIPAIYKAIETVPVFKTLYEGAIDELKTLGEEGNHILVWTAGFKDHQKMKLESSGLMTAEIQNLDVLYPPEKDRIAVEAVINEDKFIEPIIAKVKEFPQKEGIPPQNTVVIEDRPKNIIKFLKEFPEAKAVWVQQGEYAHAAMDRIYGKFDEEGNMTTPPNPTEEDIIFKDLIGSGKITVISQIKHLTKGIDALHPKDEEGKRRPLAVVCDFDDALSNNKKRKEMDEAAILKKLQEKRWALAA